MQSKSAKFFKNNKQKLQIMDITKRTISFDQKELTIQLKSQKVRDAEIEEVVDRLSVYWKLWKFAEKKNSKRMVTSSARYFIGMSDETAKVNIEWLGLGVFEHTKVAYAGIVYFKDLWDAVEAIKEFEYSLVHLFNVKRVKL